MKLDKKDVKILSLLQKDARRSFRNIAEELDITTPTVSNKINVLEKAGVIRGYVADIDTDVLSESTIILIVKCSLSNLDEVATKLELLENSTEIYILSNSRIFMKATFIDPLEINNFLSNLASVQEINDYEYYSIINTVKESPRSMLGENLSITLKCYYCKKPMKDEPVKLRLDGKIHYLCCNTCSKQYKEKYEILKSRA